MVDGLGIISMTRVFESYGIEPYDYFLFNLLFGICVLDKSESDSRQKFAQ